MKITKNSILQILQNSIRKNFNVLQRNLESFEIEFGQAGLGWLNSSNLAYLYPDSFAQYFQKLSLMAVNQFLILISSGIWKSRIRQKFPRSTLYYTDRCWYDFL